MKYSKYEAVTNKLIRYANRVLEDYSRRKITLKIAAAKLRAVGSNPKDIIWYLEAYK